MFLHMQIASLWKFILQSHTLFFHNAFQMSWSAESYTSVIRGL